MLSPVSILQSSGLLHIYTSLHPSQEPYIILGVINVISILSKIANLISFAKVLHPYAFFLRREKKSACCKLAIRFCLEGKKELSSFANKICNNDDNTTIRN